MREIQKSFLTTSLLLKDKEIELKPFPFANISSDTLINIANDQEIQKWIGHRYPYPYTKKDFQDFLKYSLKSWNDKEEFTFAIFINSEYAGNVGISLDEENISIKNLGYWIGKQFWGKGYTTRTVALLVKFCFRKLNVRRIEAGVYEGNFGSMRVLQKNGFIQEGVKIKFYLPRGSENPLDAHIFGLLNNRFRF